MIKYYLFSDDEFFNKEIPANSYRQALKICRDWFQIKGRLRIVNYTGSTRTYSLSRLYQFDLREVIIN